MVISPSDPVLFGWVCVEQMAALYGWREDGREKEEEEKFVPHWDIVHHLLPLTFKQVSLSLSWNTAFPYYTLLHVHNMFARPLTPNVLHCRERGRLC